MASFTLKSIKDVADLNGFVSFNKGDYLACNEETFRKLIEDSGMYRSHEPVEVIGNLKDIEEAVALAKTSSAHLLGVRFVIYDIVDGDEFVLMEDE